MIDGCQLLKSYHFCELQKVIIRPDSQPVRILYEWFNIASHEVNIRRRQSFVQQSRKLLACQIHSVELFGAPLQMLEIQRNVVADIPLEVIPVATLYTIAPSPKYKCVHLSGKQVGQHDAARHK